MNDDVWVADFETTTEIDYAEEGCVRVYLWHARSLDDTKEEMGFTVDEFIEFCGRKDVKMVWFHNVKFDGSYILNSALEDGWTPSPKQIKGQRTYSHIVTGQGQWMQLVLRFGKHICKIQDSAKKFPGFSLEEIAKIYGIPGKTELPLFRRPVGYKVTDVEIDRVKNDTRILRVAMADLYAQGFTKMTMASDALNNFKEMMGEKEYKKRFPKLNVKVDEYCRKAYRGGWVYVNPKWCGKDMENVTVYDVNSMFPAQMRYKRLPWGRPYIREKPCEGELYIVRFKAAFKLKKGKFPMYQRKGSFRSNQAAFVTESEGFEELTMTCIDYRLFHEQYDVYDEMDHQYVCFQSTVGMFDKYVDTWMGRKATASKEGNGPAKATAKRFLNSLYGKFGQNPHRESKVSSIDPNGVIRWETETGDSDGAYLPVATFITSYARELIVRSAQVFGDDFIYADTDSIHCKNAEAHEHLIEIDATALGKWKKESVSRMGRYVGAKKYIHVDEMDDKGKVKSIEVKCAGMPERCKENVTWENFRTGTQYDGKLAGRFVKGGYMLAETVFTIWV